MWFKNLTLFRLQESFAWSAETLAEQLAQNAFRHCLSQEILSDGWVPPLGRKSTQLVHAVNGCLLFCLQVEEKVLPAAVVKELLTDKVLDIEERELRTVRKREKDRLRDELMLELLPRAFTRSRRTYAYVDLKDHWLVIDNVSPKGIEEVTEQLRETLGSLPITPPHVQQAPASVMTQWLTQHNTLPNAIELADECELRDGTGIIRCKGQDLTSPEIQTHLQAGKQVTRLALTWQERLGFMLSEDLLVRRLRFLDLIQEQLGDVQTETDEELFDAQFALMTGELRAFLPQLLGLFGGEVSTSAKEKVPAEETAATST